MLDGGGGGYSGTDWSAKRVDEMWLAISNQDTTPHWQVVSGWRKSYELTNEHLFAVKSYRKNLIDAWPPEKNAASRAYVERLDELIVHLQQTYDSALANHEALSDAASALSISRAKLAPIVEEYNENERLLQQFAATPPTLTPGHGKTKMPEPKPPVPNGRQEELASQARSIMYSLGSDLTTAQSKLAQPTLYKPEKERGGEEDKSGDSGGSAPSLPPVVPVDPRSFPASAGSPGSAHMPSTAVGTSPAGPAFTPSTPAQQPGLILGGTGQTPVVGPSPAGNPVLPSTGGPVTTTPGILAPTLPGGFGGPSTGFGAGRGPSGEALGRMAGGPARAMPPGGVIGGSPGLGLGQPAASGRSMQRVNPAGGVINPNSPQPRGGAAGRGIGASGQPLAGAQSRTGRQNDEAEESVAWDPDNPWETAEGVEPVVLPSAEQRIDPGPAIGLS